jgi:riboflavin biosynthesis pyrimidine reductase
LGGYWPNDGLREARRLAEHRSLVDEFHVIVAPLMTGQLSPFCATLPGSIEFDLHEVEHFAGQCIFLRYAVAGK